MTKNIARFYAECFFNRFPLPTEDEIAALEQRLQITFPRDYRKFIKHFNGGSTRDAVIVLPQPITVNWRDGLVTHIEDGLDHLNGIHATFRAAELGKPGDVTHFDDNEPLQLLPIGYTSTGSMLLLDLLPESSGEVLIKFPDEGAYTIAEGIDEFFCLLKVRTEN